MRKAAADQFAASVETDKTRGSYIDPRPVGSRFRNTARLGSAPRPSTRPPARPCRAASVKPPAALCGKVVPWTPEQVTAVRHGLPSRYRAMATLGAGCGLRQGEVFGLAVDDVDFLRGVVHVRRQVKLLGGRQVFTPPKGRKVRDVPLPESVALDLAAHLRAWSIRALAEYLGHADPGFTLRVHTHFMPASEERTKRAVDQALRGGTLADGSTGCAPDVHHEAL